MAMWVWLAAGGALMLVELMTANLLFASLAVSALAAGAAAGLGFDGVVQTIVFGIAAVVSLFFLRPIALKHLKKTKPDSATNTDALIGAFAFTMTSVSETGGQIKLAGEVWTAKTESGSIAADQKVFVTAIRGATAIIKEA
jgi:membrane protein implicated in regulation of membrane protease activity